MNLITWNIQRGRRPGQASSLDHVVTSLHALADADVICLQEVSSGFTDLEGCDGANQFVGLARRLPGEAAHGPFCAVPRPAPALLCGDFNFVPGTDEHLLMQAPHESGAAPYRDLWEVAHPGVPHAPTVGVGGAEACTFDFVFGTEDMARRVRSMRVCAEVEGGDHQPVLVGIG